MTPTSISLCPSPRGIESGSSTAHILKEFMRNMAYYPPNIKSTNEELEAYMRSEMLAQNLPSSLGEIIHVAASLTELGYYDCTFEEKKTIALYTWYLIYVDDASSSNTGLFVVFGQRFFSKEPQLDPVLNALTAVLLRVYDQYDIFMANSILAAALDFVNSTCIEPEIKMIPLVQGAFRFPWFLRDRTGVATGFAALLFPKSKGIDTKDVIQALPDMHFCISGVNDLLSFHKEDIAGETTNYVHNRSSIEGKDPIDILRDLKHELQVSRQTIYKVLENCPRAKSAWMTWDFGYVAWHLSQKRYMLEGLGFN